MKNLTIGDLANNLDIKIVPVVCADGCFFHIYLTNAPFFVMCKYKDTEEGYDEKTLAKVCFSGCIDSNLIEEFNNYLDNLLPDFSGWDETNVFYDTIKYDNDGILRIDFCLTYCEINK